MTLVRTFPQIFANCENSRDLSTNKLLDAEYTLSEANKVAPQENFAEDEEAGLEGYALIINGPSLTYALKRNLERSFLDIGCLCRVRAYILC